MLFHLLVHSLYVAASCALPAPTAPEFNVLQRYNYETNPLLEALQPFKQQTPSEHPRLPLSDSLQWPVAWVPNDPSAVSYHPSYGFPSSPGAAHPPPRVLLPSMVSGTPFQLADSHRGAGHAADEIVLAGNVGIDNPSSSRTSSSASASHFSNVRFDQSSLPTYDKFLEDFVKKVTIGPGFRPRAPGLSTPQDGAIRQAVAHPVERITDPNRVPDLPAQASNNAPLYSQSVRPTDSDAMSRSFSSSEPAQRQSAPKTTPIPEHEAAHSDHLDVRFSSRVTLPTSYIVQHSAPLMKELIEELVWRYKFVRTRTFTDLTPAFLQQPSSKRIRIGTLFKRGAQVFAFDLARSLVFVRGHEAPSLVKLGSQSRALTLWTIDKGPNGFPALTLRGVYGIPNDWYNKLYKLRGVKAYTVGSDGGKRRARKPHMTR